MNKVVDVTTSPPGAWWVPVRNLLDLVRRSVGVTDEEHVVVAWQFDVPGTGDVLGQIPTGPCPDEPVAFSVHDEGR